MRKFILGVAAVAALVIPSAALAAPASQPRQCDPVVTADGTKTATFSMWETRGEGGQWRTNFSVSLDAAGNITSGTTSVVGVIDGNVVTEAFRETVTGGTLVGNVLNASVVRDFNVIASYTLTDVDLTGGSFPKNTAPNPGWDVSVTFTDLHITDGLSETSYKNHGEFVSAMGGGKDAAHSCVGMPAKSNGHSG